MKKNLILVAFMLLFFAFIVTNCNAQSSGNNEQRLIGTWTSLVSEGDPLVFNANGTVSGWYNRTNWAAAGDTIIIYNSSSSNKNAFRFQISSDGRTLIIGDSAYRKN